MPKRKRKDYVVVAVLLVITFLLIIGILVYRSYSNGISMPAMHDEATEQTDEIGWFESLKNELLGIDEGGAPAEDLESSTPTTGTTIPTQYGDIPLSSDQVKMIESLGVDIETLPEKITPELEECVRSRLGDDRIQEIIQSGTVGPLDAIKVAPCL